jgi:hypothetical protein
MIPAWIAPRRSTRDFDAKIVAIGLRPDQHEGRRRGDPAVGLPAE